MAMLEIKDLKVSYGMIQAIKGISFEVNKGEVIALIDANGAGKTTGQLLADGGSAFELSFGRSGIKIIGTTRCGSLELVDLLL